MKQKFLGQLQLEICTDNVEDWETFLDLCAEGFQDDYRRLFPDLVNLKPFLLEYFRYVYDTEFSAGRAGLVCLKQIDSGLGSSKILYAACNNYNSKKPTHGDKSAMMEIDPRACEIVLEENAWVEKNVHEKIREMAKQLDFNIFFGNYHVAAKKYRGMGLSKRYFSLIPEMLYRDGVKRGVLDPSKPTVDYGFIRHVRLKRVQSNEYKLTEIAHLHHRCENSVGKRPICVNDPGYEPGQDHDCRWIFASLRGKPNPKLLSQMKQLFLLSSSL